MSQPDPAILRRFEQPGEVRTFELGKFEIVHIGGMTIGRATYLPGLEMVDTCRRQARSIPLRGGTSRLCDQRCGDSGVPGWAHLRTARRRDVLYFAGTA